MFLKLHINIFLTSLFMFQDYYLCDTTTEHDYEPDDIQSEINEDEYFRRTIKIKYCARELTTVYRCLPKLNEVKRTVFEECGLDKEEQTKRCKPYECVYDNMGTSQNPGPYRKYMDDFKKQNPEMTEAVNIAMANCTEVKLGQQGLMKNCSGYDIHVCLGKELIQNMPISLWKQPGCSKEREYLTKCLVCPEDCRAVLHKSFKIKPGTCLACSDF